MSELVSKCVLRVQVENPNERQETTEDEASSLNSAKKQHQKPRDISVETFPSLLESPRDDWGLLPAASRETTPNEAMEGSRSEIGVFSGNPFVEITKGILHLYKEDVLSERKEALTLCILGVPTSMTCHDLLAFTAPCHDDIAHIRVLRDSSPNQYMALLTFRVHESAMEFYVTYNGSPFNSLETDNICRIVWVSRVEWAHDNLPPPGHTELPICPVCLERMDESVDGVLTILCNHAFHADCLEQWGDSTCPVCRCVQSPEQAASSECEECLAEGRTNSQNGSQSVDALWICLICGHVGCGRYQGGHAALHYRESGHCYALQLGSHRVWDYKGDNFVHRLLQNKADGKLVASEGPPSEAECAQEKVDSVQLEFTYLLTSQLEEQRNYFEEKLAHLDSLMYDEMKEVKGSLASAMEENKELKKRLDQVQKEKVQLEKKVSQMSVKLSTSLNDLNEERQLGRALRNNQQQWQAKLSKLEEENKVKDGEIVELKEQLRDLMFFIEAKQVVDKAENREEIAGGTMTVGQVSEVKKKRSRNRKR